MRNVQISITVRFNLKTNVAFTVMQRFGQKALPQPFFCWASALIQWQIKVHPLAILNLSLAITLSVDADCAFLFIQRG